MAEGVSDGTDPNGLVTREQMVTMLWRYAVAKGYDVSIGESTNILSYADFGQIASTLSRRCSGAAAPESSPA